MILGDAMEVLKELPENYFDCLICNDILEHLPSPEHFLKEVRRILTKNATITTSVPNVRFWGHFVHYFVYKDWKYADFGILDHTHLKFFTKKSLVRLLQDSNIEVEIIKGITPVNTILYNLSNILSLGFISDMRYLEFAVRGRFM
jgi:2-polyprenyl-3-methyl-5-hydroxy-6-metoxy-1,4-benzoquinol methylase